MQPGEMLEEMLDQQSDVFFPLTQRRYSQLENTQPIIQILAESLLLHELFQVSIRRRNHTHIDLDFFSPTDW